MHASAVPPAHPTEPQTRTAAIEARPTFDLSIRQLLASVAAAVTAAILGSHLGVAGTLIGAALASAITMVAGAVYSHSLAAAQYRVRQARVTQLIEGDAPTEVIPTPQQAWGLLAPVVPPLAVPTMPHPMPPVTAPAQERRVPHWAMAGVGTLVACALALLTVTGIEAVRGTPLSGGTSGGLSVLGGHSAGVAKTTSKTTVPPVESSTGTSSSPAGTGSDAAQTTTDPAVATVTVTTTDPAGTSTASSSSQRSSPASSTTVTPTDSSAAATSAFTPITTVQTPSSIGNPVR